MANEITPEIIELVDDQGRTFNLVDAEARRQISELSEEIEELQAGGSGLSATQKTLLLNILKKGVYTENMSATISALESSFDVSVTSVTLSESSVSISGATTKTVTATVRPAGAASVTWVSSNTSVATVANGVITAVGNGSATITAVAGNKSATCSVTVSGIAVHYSVSYNLTDVTSSNTATSVTEGDGYLSNLTVASGYVVSGVTVTMGGTDVTSTAYADGVITIDSVTGAIVITASAQEDAGWVDGVAYTNIEWTNQSYNSSGVLSDSDWSKVAWLPCKGASRITITGEVYGNYGYLLCDANKNFVKRTSPTATVWENTSNEKYHNIPLASAYDNVYYVAICARNTKYESVTFTPHKDPVNPSTWEYGTIYDTSIKKDTDLNGGTGIESAKTGTDATDFIFCYGANNIVLCNNARKFVYFYDADKNFISYLTYQSNQSLSIPNTAYYLRIVSANGINGTSVSFFDMAYEYYFREEAL